MYVRVTIEVILYKLENSTFFYNFFKYFARNIYLTKICIPYTK